MVEKMSVKEFADKSNIEIIQDLMKINNGYITSKQISELGIHRMYLKMMKDKSMIKKVGKGIYVDSSMKVDNYFVFSMELSNIIYSHMTGLFLQGFSRKDEDRCDVTVCNNYFNYKLKKCNVFYVSQNVYNLGLTEAKTKDGNVVRVYDVERCICDIIKSKNRMDLDMVKYSIKKYLKSEMRNLKKLFEYAEMLEVKNEVIDVVSLLYDGSVKDILKEV